MQQQRPPRPAIKIIKPIANPTTNNPGAEPQVADPTRQVGLAQAPGESNDGFE